MSRPGADANPFATSRVAPTASGDGGLRHYGRATQGQRLLNSLIDSAASFVWLLAAVMALALTVPSVFEDTSEATYQICGLIGILSYYIALEAITGRTLGKLVTGTCVVRRDDDGPPSLWQIIGRSAARFVPLEAFSCLGEPPDGWHDRWSGTQVVRLRPNKMDRLAHVD